MFKVVTAQGPAGGFGFEMEALDGHGTITEIPADEDAFIAAAADADAIYCRGTKVSARVIDALPVRAGRPVEALARVAGLDERAVAAGLGRLALRGLAQRTGAAGLWRRAPVPRQERLSASGGGEGVAP